MLFVIPVKGLLQLPSLLLTSLEGCATIFIFAVEVLDITLNIQIDVARFDLEVLLWVAEFTNLCNIFCSSFQLFLEKSVFSKSMEILLKLLLLFVFCVFQLSSLCCRCAHLSCLAEVTLGIVCLPVVLDPSSNPLKQLKPLTIILKVLYLGQKGALPIQMLLPFLVDFR